MHCAVALAACCTPEQHTAGAALMHTTCAAAAAAAVDLVTHPLRILRVEDLHRVQAAWYLHERGI